MAVDIFNNRAITYISCIFIIFYIGNIFASLLFPFQTMAQQMRNEQIIIDSKIIQNENDPNFFPCAFAHGTFDVLDQKGWINGLSVHNIGTDNLTIDVHAYYVQEHQWIFRKGYSFICDRYIGFVGSHYFYVFGFNGVSVFP